MKTAVIDVGGGLRGIYAAGVLDYCMDHNIDFDLCIGISAGSANLASYVAGQKGRNYLFYREYSTRPEYMSLENFKNTRSYINMDYIYGTLSNTGGEYPLDYPAFAKSPKELITVATNAMTGRPAYFGKDKIEKNNYAVFKASCSIPVVNKPYPIANVPFFDGALSDPIPLDKAFEMGADKVVLLLTKPADHDRTPYKDSLVAAFMKHYPKAARQLRNRTVKYNEAVHRARELEKQGRVLIVAPDDTCGVDTLSNDSQALHSLYLKGVQDGQKILPFLQQPVFAPETESESSAKTAEE